MQLDFQSEIAAAFDRAIRYASPAWEKLKDRTASAIVLPLTEDHLAHLEHFRKKRDPRALLSLADRLMEDGHPIGEEIAYVLSHPHRTDVAIGNARYGLKGYKPAATIAIRGWSPSLGGAKERLRDIAESDRHSSEDYFPQWLAAGFDLPTGHSLAAMAPIAGEPHLLELAAKYMPQASDERRQRLAAAVLARGLYEPPRVSSEDAR